eukprot:6257826-Alexandrium_andersonii.AAC.1
MPGCQLQAMIAVALRAQEDIPIPSAQSILQHFGPAGATVQHDVQRSGSCLVALQEAADTFQDDGLGRVLCCVDQLRKLSNSSAAGVIPEAIPLSPPRS